MSIKAWSPCARTLYTQDSVHTQLVYRSGWFVRVLIAASMFLTIASQFLVAQTTIGVQPLGSYTSGLDQINLADLGVHIDIPLYQTAARGQGMGTTVHLIYDSSYVGTESSGPLIADVGWRIHASETAYPGQILIQSTGGGCSTQTFTYFFVDSSGFTHNFSQKSTTQSCNGSTPVTTAAIGTATDGSGYLLNASEFSGTVTSPAGLIYYTNGGNSTTLTDTNGNQGQDAGEGWNHIIGISSSGSQYSTNPQTGAVTARSPGLLTYTDASGNTQTITINYALYGIATCNYNQQVGLVSSIVFPDQTAYHFTYNSGPGALASMQLPTGGTISYSGNLGANPSCSAAAPPASVTRTTPDGATTYQRTLLSSQSYGGPSATKTVVTKPDKTSESVNFAYSTQTSSTSSAYSYETLHTWTNASSSTLRQTMRCYNGGGTTCTSTPVSLPITQIETTTTLDNALHSETLQTLNTQGLPTELDEYDYNATAPTRKTTTTYASLANNILDRPQSTTIQDGAGHTLSKTTNAYDEYSLATSSVYVQPVTGSRGNRTSRHDWNNVTQATLDSHWYYDNAGQVVKYQDPSSAVAGLYLIPSYDSTDTYVTSASSPTPSSGVALSTSATFDQKTGLMATSVDLNNVETTYSYNSMLQLTGLIVTEKTGSLFTDSTFSYSLTYGANQRGVQADGADTETHVDTLGRPDRVAVYNGQASNSWYIQDKCYDVNGRLQFLSYTYQGTGFDQAKVCSGAGDTYVYDALGRVTSISHSDGETIRYTYAGRATKVVDENVVTRISQVDELGRITSLCEVSSAALQGVSPVNCGQDIAANGYLTTYAYTTDGSSDQVTTVTQGTQTRIFVTDSLGRTVSVTEPEPGTTTYNYAYNATGMVVTRARPKANQTSSTVLTTTTTQYDVLGRMVSTTYNDGLTPTKLLTYDAQAGWAESSSQLNLKGRLSQSHTVTGATLDTGSLFSYDALGRITNNWQCTPSGCGASTYDKPMSFTYDTAGNLTSQTAWGTGTITYGRSQAGELTYVVNETYTLTGGFGTATLLTSAANGPNGPISYMLPNGLSQANSYDSLGRLNGGWWCIGAPSVGCPNQRDGEAFNWSGSRISGYTENYFGPTFTNLGSFTPTYDDFNRLVGITESTNGPQASTWSRSYNYVYDRYGNRSQANAPQGGPTFSQAYNAANNQLLTGGYQYDAAGNMTYDTFHHYSYDAEGNILQVDGGQAYAYDAFNRRARGMSAGQPIEFVFDLSGRVVSSWLPKATIATQANIYADGQQLAYRAGDGNTYFNHTDWLGTDRVHADLNGAIVAIHTSLPWGDGGNDATPTGDGGWDFDRFGDMDDDTESNTYHASFRQYSQVQARWLSPDPYDGSYDLSNPQSFNRYAYALNNPMSLNDPSGLSTGQPYVCGTNPDGTSRVCLQASTGPDPNSGTGIDGCWWCMEYGGFQGPLWGASVSWQKTITKRNSGTAPNNGVPQNPCAQAGNAQDPSYYINRARSSQINPIQLAQDLASFRRGQPLDAQPFGASPAYGNYVYGVYLRTAGLPLSVALAGANWYAGGGAGDGKAQYSGPLDPNYPNIPPANVANITNGYNAARSGTVCHIQ